MTSVGVLRATPKGLELVSVLPGIDVRRDVLALAPCEIAVPASGASVIDAAELGLRG